MFDAAQSYNAEFFCSQADGSRRSADVVVPIVLDLLHPKSVVDVGGGIGTWAAAFSDAGVEKVLAIDGDYVDRKQLQIPADRFQPADLTKPLVMDRRFDLAVSLEVAEHLLAGRARSFVADLVQLAPAVLFSAAVPNQGGVDHVNERWQDYWSGLFAEHGMRPVDIVRPRVWNDERVLWWYAQNTLLYLPDEQAAGLPAPTMLRVVHPRAYEGLIQSSWHQQRSLRNISHNLPGALARSFKYRLKR